jgi:hypothetical protein
MITATSQRVSANTAEAVNERLVEQMARRIVFYQQHPELIEQRLGELDQEWDVERVIQSEAPLLTLMGIGLSVTSGRQWLLLPLFAQSMLVVHAVQGFYPLLPLFRRLGFRTEREIAAERYALKVVRGDFAKAAEGDNRQQQADEAFQASRFTGL